MLKVNVGLSRKVSENFNSHGFSVNLEGEVLSELNDAEAVVAKVQEYFDVAEESLLRQVERYESDSAIASRDQAPIDPVTTASQAPAAATRSPTRESASPITSSGGPATNKQVQFLLNLSKRFGLNKSQLETHIAEILGQPTGVYDLTKRDAGLVLDSLTAGAKSTAASRS